LAHREPRESLDLPSNHTDEKAIRSRRRNGRNHGNGVCLSDGIRLQPEELRMTSGQYQADMAANPEPSAAVKAINAASGKAIMQRITH